MTKTFVKPIEDMHTQAIVANLTFFVDGSCSRDAAGSHAGYAVVQLHWDVTFTDVQTMELSQPCSAQLAEIKTLMAACQPAAGKRVNVYNNSAYAYGVCHVTGKIWQQQGFRRADGT